MKRGILIFSLVLFQMVLAHSVIAGEAMPKPKSNNPEAQALLDQALEVLKQEYTIPNLDQAISLLEKANQLDPNNHDILVELADKNWQKGDLLPEKTDADFKARKAYFEKGLKYAEQALKIKESAGAHYWFAANLGSSYEHASILSQAKIFPSLKKNCDWIQTRNPEYFYGGAARIWSKVVSKVPDIVLKMVGEDPNQVFGWLEDAIKTEPRYLLNYVYKGQFCWRMGKKDDALSALDYALKQDPSIFTEEVAKNKLALRKAQEMWKEFTGKEYPAR